MADGMKKVLVKFYNEEFRTWHSWLMHTYEPEAILNMVSTISKGGKTKMVIYPPTEQFLLCPQCGIWSHEKAFKTLPHEADMGDGMMECPHCGDLVSADEYVCSE